jgi:hypothetical protein
MSIEYEMYLNEVAFARAEGGARTPGLSRLRSLGTLASGRPCSAPSTELASSTHRLT